MRIPFKADDYFAKEVNVAFKCLQDEYFEGAKPYLQTREVPVMLGDGSVSTCPTFDLPKIIAYYEKLVNSFDRWVGSMISKSSTEDLHRIYFQISQQVDKYYILGYFGIQFHALPYYKVDRRVIEIQKELSKIAVEAATIFSSLADRGNSMVEHELQKIGYNDLEPEELFTKLFEDQELVRGLDKKARILEAQFPEFAHMRVRKNQLFGELNDLLVELYQISPILIGHDGLMQGEEGLVIYFDMETIRNRRTGRRDPYLNTERVTKDIADRITNELDELARSLKKTTINKATGSAFYRS